ncbi:killer protein of pyocin s3 [Salmonella enterica]|nr:killer protein of pyocin s3 [Salmonella enterica]
MARGYFLVRGDKTTCGGKIVEGADDHTIMGMPQAREMDRVTCGRYSGMFIIVGGVPQTDIHGRLIAGSLHSKSSCPCQSRFIASMMNDVYETDSSNDNNSIQSRGGNNGQEQQSPGAKKNFTSDNDGSPVTPVFAKSCLRGNGCTDAGTTSEPVENFGKVGFFQASAVATIINQGMGNGIRAFTLQALEGSATRAASVRLAVPNPWVIGFVGTFWSEKLNSGEQDFIDNIRLQQLAAQNGTAITRLRFQWVMNSTTGNLEVKGYHTGAEGQISDQVPVRQMKLASNGTYEFWEDGETKGPSLIWTPDNPGFTAPSDTGNDDVFVPPPTILILPEPTETGGYTEILPMPDEKDFRDYILVHPEGGFDPIYIYFSKPPVNFLDVDLYGNFSGRSRQKKYEADHMPSKAAVKMHFKRMNPNLSEETLEELVQNVAAIVTPTEVHRQLSETYGWRNSPAQIDMDSRDLRRAVDHNLDAIKSGLKQHGATEEQIEAARAKMHKLNMEMGLYK